MSTQTSQRTIHPTRDWYILLAVFFLALIASLVWNVTQFSRVKHGEQLGSPTTTSQENLTVQSIQDIFAAREAQRLKYVTEYRFVDPSL